MHSIEPPVYWWWFGDLILLKYKLEEHPPQPRHWFQLRRVIRRAVAELKVTVTVIDLARSPGRMEDPAPRRN
jgi:hypothetical protein